jgi:hypothetical protein
MEIACKLPKLHPGIARLDTHCRSRLSGEFASAIIAKRRQVVTWEWNIEPDFPVMHEFPEFWEEPGMMLEEVEEVERRL